MWGTNMKRIFILFLTIVPMVAIAAEPSTSCPSGYVAAVVEYMTIADGSCPSGYTSIGTEDGCLISTPDDSCIMYAPANTEYTDTFGTYEFTAICPLE